MPLISGGGGGSAFNGGTITAPLEVDPPTGGPGLVVKTAGLTDGGAMIVVEGSGGAQHVGIASAGGGVLLFSGGSAQATDTALFLSANTGQSVDIATWTAPNGVPWGGVDSGGRVYTTKGFASQVVTSGALLTVAPVSGTTFQCSTVRDVFLTVPVTYNPGVATTATCKVELSPDNATFSELVTVTKPVGTVFDGSIEAVQLNVPAAWRVRLTVVNATLGIGTYY